MFQNDMNNEFKRYATFNGFRSPDGIWPLQVAQAGFYRSASCEEFQVTCFACGLMLDLRAVGRVPVMEIHRRQSPECSFVVGCSNNQPVPPVDPSAALEWLRQNFSFDSSRDGSDAVHSSHSPPNTLTQSVEIVSNEADVFDDDTLATIVSQLPHLSNLNTLEQSSELPSLPMDLVDGFANTTLSSVPIGELFQVGNNSPSNHLPFHEFGSSSLGGPGDVLVTDGEPDGVVGDYPPTAMPDSEVKGYANNTLQTPGELGEAGVRRQVTYRDLGIITQRPKRPEFARLQKRLDTFLNWMGPNISQTRDQIAEAGFYYAGYSDCCRCFYCGGGLKSWEAEDNPWIEHARWFPSCPFILTNKGQDFVDAVESLARTNNNIFMLDVDTEMQRITSTSLSQPPQVMEEAMDMQTPQPIEDSNFVSEAERLMDENLSLRQPELCKICMDAEVSIVYVPCGHLVTCGTCAPTVKSCPVCRENIGGQIRIQRTD